MDNLGALDTGINEGAVAAVGHLVELDLGGCGLDAETDDLIGDLVVGDEDIGLVVHADTDEAELRRCDLVVGDDGVDGASSESSIGSGIGDLVLHDESVLGTKDGNVETRELLDGEAGDDNVLDVRLDGKNLAVLRHELVELDSGPTHTDSGLGARSSEARARIRDRFLGRDEDGTLAVEIDAILLYGQLLSVRASLDDDSITLGSRVDCLLDALAGLHGDGATVLSVLRIPIGVWLVFGRFAASTVFVLAVCSIYQWLAWVNCEPKGSTNLPGR